MLADGPGVLLVAEEAVEKVVERALIVAPALIRHSTAAMRVLDNGLGIDVDDRGLQLLGDLRELVGELLRGWSRQRRGRVGGLLTFLPSDSVGNNRTNQNAD